MAASGEVVKLLGTWASPFAIRARIALNLKSVDYEYMEENLGNKSDLLLKLNPVHKKIPVLIHGENPICESLIIVQYIDEVWTNEPALLPSDPHDRALARFWAAFVDDKFFPLMRDLRTAQGEGEESAVVGKIMELLVVLDEAFVECSKGKAFFGGDDIGYIDIAVGCMLGWIPVIEKVKGLKFIEESKTPNLFAWAETFRQHSAVKDVLPSTEKLFEFYKFLQVKQQEAAASSE